MEVAESVEILIYILYFMNISWNLEKLYLILSDSLMYVVC